MSASKPTNNHRQTVSAYLVVQDCASAIDFYRRAFGAAEQYRLTGPGGKIGHAEIKIGESVIMLADEHPDFGALSPRSVGGSPVKLHLAVDDADAAMARAVDAGGTQLRAVQDQFYGERTGLVADPYGYSWFLAQHIETVSPQEMQRRWDASSAA